MHRSVQVIPTTTIAQKDLTKVIQSALKSNEIDISLTKVTESGVSAQKSNIFNEISTDMQSRLSLLLSLALESLEFQESTTLLDCLYVQARRGECEKRENEE